MWKWLRSYRVGNEDMVAGAYKCPRKEELLPLEFMTIPLQNLDPRALLACFVLGLFFSMVAPTFLRLSENIFEKV